MTLLTLFSSEERTLLREAFFRLIPRSDEMAGSLYGHLFERHPETRPLFKSPMDEQRNKLIRMLAMLIDALDEPEKFAAECRASGERHRGYGARPEHYAPLGESLILALRETLVPPLSAEEEALWIRLYDEVSRMMIEA